MVGFSAKGVSIICVRKSMSTDLLNPIHCRMVTGMAKQMAVGLV